MRRAALCVLIFWGLMATVAVVAAACSSSEEPTITEEQAAPGRRPGRYDFAEEAILERDPTTEKRYVYRWIHLPTKIERSRSATFASPDAFIDCLRVWNQGPDWKLWPTHAPLRERHTEQNILWFDSRRYMVLKDDSASATD